MGDRPPAPDGYVLLSHAEYRRLLIAAEGDDSIIWCERCGAWLDHNDPAAATIVSEYRGCWKAISDRRADVDLCRSWRAPDQEPSLADLEPGADLRVGSDHG